MAWGRSGEKLEGMKRPFVFLQVQVVAVEGRAGIKKIAFSLRRGGRNFTLISERYTAVLVSVVLTSQPCKPESCLLVERMTFHLHSLLSKEVMLAV